ncbi:PREDICTED: uncharacterized protein LOC106814565 [Priapulus caudatus]|uniref:Uncharacterized protein LOC106814565 n=1 Tax=Priapulus caudatus TaxID=37621 RepID=A0ABM1EQB1_PRICU|nr:PREDICTED: uncharacterized protein LOC106814565 [Priapulus caudatus]
MTLLTTNPDYRKYATFAEFGKDESQMRSSEELEVFGTSVLMAIDKMVASFDDVDAGVAHLQSVGKLHAKLDGFTPNMFANMKDAFMYAASVAFEDRYNDQVEQCFQTLFDFCIKYMQEGLQS